MAANVFNGKIDAKEIETYLTYIEEAGLIKKTNQPNDPLKQQWKFVKTIR